MKTIICPECRMELERSKSLVMCICPNCQIDMLKKEEKEVENE